MNRVLRRPMFRLGGSAEGITSGLDAPNINASRKGYKEGSTFWDFLPAGDFDREWAMKEAAKNKNNDDVVVEQENIEDWRENMPARSLVAPTYSQDDLMSYDEHTDTDMRDLVSSSRNNEGGINSINTRNEGTDTSATGMDSYMKEYLDAMKKYGGAPEEIKPGEPGSVSSMLMNFGLNLLAQPGGNLAGAIGKAGSPALQQFQKARLADKKQREGEKRQDVRDALATSASIYETAIKAAAEGKDKGFEFQSKQDTLVNLQDKEQEIRDKMAKITDTESDEYKALQQDLENNNELKKLITKEEDLIGKMILASIAQQGPKSEGGYFEIEDYFKWISDKIRPGSEKKATGGRVGLQMGGTPLMEEVVDSVEETGSTDVVEDLTYNELRARLPREISNDVVQLIATSKQALVDFANIRTQQDVDNFNQSYNVDLSLPQEG
jgi:hypothetical protein